MYLNDGEHQPLCNKLKRLGITCIFVAAKVTEVSAPSALEFAGAAEVSTFTRSQLLLAERALLRELEYNLYLPTASSFSSAYLSVTLPHLKKNGVVSNYEGDWDEDPCEEITEIVDYLLEASAVSHKSLDFAPSVAARRGDRLRLEQSLRRVLGATVASARAVGVRRERPARRVWVLR